MTYLVERLAELKRHLDHLRAIAPRVTDRVLEALQRLDPIEQFLKVVAEIERRS